MAAARGRAVRGDRVHHARRPGAGGDRRARAERADDRDGVRAELPRLQEPGRDLVLKGIAPEVKELRAKGKGVLIVDDLVDTGKTARVVRDLLPQGAFRHRLCQADGAAAGRHLHHRSVAGHLDLFSVGHRPRVPAADPRGWGLETPWRPGLKWFRRSNASIAREVE